MIGGGEMARTEMEKSWKRSFWPTTPMRNVFPLFVDINLVGANHRAPPDVVVTTDSNQSRVFVGDVDIWIALFPIFSWEGSSERERANEEKKYREEN
jgi:hypothetical protein